MTDRRRGEEAIENRIMTIENCTLPIAGPTSSSGTNESSSILGFQFRLLFVAFTFSCALLPILSGCGSSANKRVVLYCAQDEDFAEASLADFTQHTGLPVAPKYDTEADKSVSLYTELLAERDRPRCDVFWNNEIINTIRLQRQGMLQAYESPSAAAYPASCRASDHSWHAFAARARILIVNKQLVNPEEMPKSILDLADPRWKGRVVIARPQFGTSATMAACLFQVLGEEKAEKFYRGLKENNVQIAPGNKQVADWVGDGRTPDGEPVAIGITDTDDALEAIKDGKPVVMIFPDRGAPKGSKMGTLFIPNTVCILRGCPNPEGARKLVDYLLSPEVEKRLAEESEGHQIPLNPEVKVSLPPQLETPKSVKAMDVDFEKAVDLLPQVQKFIQNEFAAP
jgi:iron(III) transport system substrate-binding protein